VIGDSQAECDGVVQSTVTNEDDSILFSDAAAAEDPKSKAEFSAGVRLKPVDELQLSEVGSTEAPEGSETGDQGFPSDALSTKNSSATNTLLTAGLGGPVLGEAQCTAAEQCPKVEADNCPKVDEAQAELAEALQQRLTELAEVESTRDDRWAQLSKQASFLKMNPKPETEELSTEEGKPVKTVQRFVGGKLVEVPVGRLRSSTDPLPQKKRSTRRQLSRLLWPFGQKSKATEANGNASEESREPPQDAKEGAPMDMESTDGAGPLP